jgi:hypothetical protein
MTLELVQTETPLPSTDKEFSQQLATLDVRQSQFSPGGFLALTEGVGDLIDAGLGALGVNKSDGTKLQVWVYRRGSDATRIAEMHDLLLSARKEKALLVIDVGGRTYSDYAITDVGFRQQGPEEKGAFTLSLRHIRKAPSTSNDPALGLSLPSPGEIALAAAKAAVKAGLSQTPADIEQIKSKSLDAASQDDTVLGNVAEALGF